MKVFCFTCGNDKAQVVATKGEYNLVECTKCGCRWRRSLDPLYERTALVEVDEARTTPSALQETTVELVPTNRFIETIRKNVTMWKTGEAGRWDGLPQDLRRFLRECADYMEVLERVAMDRLIKETKITTNISEPCNDSRRILFEQRNKVY